MEIWGDWLGGIVERESEFLRRMRMVEMCYEEPIDEKEEKDMSSGERVIALLAGVGLGVGLALLFAPQSGADTREWIGDTTDDGMKQLRKTGRRTLRNLRSAVSKGESTVASAFESGKDALDSLSAKLS